MMVMRPQPDAATRSAPSHEEAPAAKRLRQSCGASSPLPADRCWRPGDERAAPGAIEEVDLPESLRASIFDPKSFSDIPIIDLGLDEETLIKQMRYACEVVGFMQVVGHGVPTELQERHLEVQKKFFRLSSEVKRRLSVTDDCPVRGYFGKGGEDLDRVLGKEVDDAAGQKIAKQTRKDNKEAFDLNGVPWSQPKGGYVANIFSLQAPLPTEEELPGFKEVMDEYADAMFQLAKKVLSVIARVLGKPANFFDCFLRNPVATHRLLHYWPLTDLRTQIGVGEHTDYGLLTILRQDKVGGLQVLNAKDSRWVHCPPVDNAFVINIGDMLGRWTGQRVKSTVHRVVNLSPEERFSSPFFVEPDLDTIIELGALTGEKAHDAGETTLETAEEILGRFYRASGLLKAQGQPPADTRMRTM